MFWVHALPLYGKTWNSLCYLICCLLFWTENLIGSACGQYDVSIWGSQAGHTDGWRMGSGYNCYLLGHIHHRSWEGSICCSF